MKPLSTTRTAVVLPAALQGIHEDEIDLSGDYSHYTVPKPVADAVVHAAQATDLGRATLTAGRPLRDAVIVKLAEYNDLQVRPEQVVLAAGGTRALCYTFATLADAGESVLVPDPGWPGYQQLLATWGIQAVPYPIGLDGRPDYETLDALVTPSTKALVISQPNHPCGAVLDQQALLELHAWLRRHDLYLVSDETYDLIRFHPLPAIGPARYDPDGRVITIYSFAKTHALAGLRLGYAVAAPPVAWAIEHTQRASLASPSCLAMAAGLAALEMDFTVIDSMRQFYWQQRETLKAVLPEALVTTYPRGGFLALLDIRSTSLPDGDAFAERCFKEQGLKVASGRLFGERSAHLVRISLAARERVFGQAIERLLRFVEEHTA